MITIDLRGSEPTATGLTPGEDILLVGDGETWIIHRHGPICHAHRVDDPKGVRP
jgi:hypothetical protein